MKVSIIFTSEAQEAAKQGARKLGAPLSADFTGPKFTDVIAFDPSSVVGMIAVRVPYLDAVGEPVTYLYKVADISRIKIED